MNKYQEALDKVKTHCLSSPSLQNGAENGFGPDYNMYHDCYEDETQLLQECINENLALKEIIKGLRNENFVHILTHNGIKYAFQNRNQVDDFIKNNNLSKVHLMSIQYYREKPLDWSKE